LTSGLLTLAGAALIEPNPAIDPAPSLSCTAFQVGSPHAANTRIQLYNAGPERAGVRLDFVDDDGRDSQTVGYNPILDPSTSSEFVFRTPPRGAAVKLSWSSRTMHASTEILRDDGPPLRSARPARVCRAIGATEIDRTLGVHKEQSQRRQASRSNPSQNLPVLAHSRCWCRCVGQPPSSPESCLPPRSMPTSPVLPIARRSMPGRSAAWS
jgi:hypothetical protein